MGRRAATRILHPPPAPLCPLDSRKLAEGKRRLTSVGRDDPIPLPVSLHRLDIPFNVSSIPLSWPTEVLAELLAVN